MEPGSHATFSRAWIAERLTRPPVVVPPMPISAGLPTAEPAARPLIPAAVLIALVETAAGFEVVLTRRTAHLTAHAGQISFPGGRIEPQDADDVAAALREAEEEILCPPLAFLMDPANHRRDSRELAGRVRHFHAIQWQQHYIWGATAGMLVNLAGQLGRLAAGDPEKEVP